MRRASNKSSMANMLLGLGGKIETNEALMNSAVREFYEESGLTILNPQFRGTFQWIDDSPIIGVTHIITATEYKGELQNQNREGVLEWHSVDDLSSLEGLADYQKLFLERIISDPSSFYSGIAFFDKDRLLSYTDNYRQM